MCAIVSKIKNKKMMGQEEYQNFIQTKKVGNHLLSANIW